MTNTEKITAIENKIRGEVPRLMEKTEGCEVESFFGEGREGREVILFECGKCPKHKTAKGCEENIYNDCYLDDAYCIKYGYEEEGFGTYILLAKELEDTERYEVIGHPIQLSDLLYVLKKQEFVYTIDTFGDFLRLRTALIPNKPRYNVMNALVEETGIKYNLSLSFKENLETDPELTDFLFNLICTK